MWLDSILTNNWAWWRMPVIPAMQESANRRIMVQNGPGIEQHPISKKKKNQKNTKSAGGVAEVVVCLPASTGPEFNPSTAKKQIKRKKSFPVGHK
jgi:hypothetical protein